MNYFLIALVPLMIIAASVGLYFGLPKLRPIKCYELASANKPRSRYPFLTQGILLTIGAVFVLVVTSIGEWNSKALHRSSKERKCKHILRFQAILLISSCCVVGLSSMIALFSHHYEAPMKLSPSFVDACRPNPPVSELCPKIWVYPIPEVNVTCTTNPSRWIPALSESYPHMVPLQTYLMIFLVAYAWNRISSARYSLVIGLVAMALVQGIGNAAVENNESLLDEKFSKYNLGYAFFLLLGCITGSLYSSVVGVIEEEKFHELLLQLKGRPSRQQLPNPRGPLQPRSTQMEPV